MATWDRGEKEFTCPQCGAVYECTYEDLPSRERGKQECEDCGATVHSWNGSRDYEDWKLIRHGRGAVKSFGSLLTAQSSVKKG